MTAVKHIGILCGGRSAEHEVSLQSAKNISRALNPQKYTVSIVGLDKSGVFRLYDSQAWLVNEESPQAVCLAQDGLRLLLDPGTGQFFQADNRDAPPLRFDVVFPVLHGPYGEDGTIQGLLKLAGIPFVGPSVLGSAVGMDKEVMKRLLNEAGISTALYQLVTAWNRDSLDPAKVIKQLGLPLFVKPANMGSSVGVTKVSTQDALSAAVDIALMYDSKVLIEEAIVGREIECSVLGNSSPRASVAGEVIPHHEFYSYEAKYIDAQGAGLEIPANLSADELKAVQKLAVETFQVLCCEGMTRVDFFLTKEGILYVNEVNTIPGFTKISMYPKLWEQSGLSYSQLLDELVEYALERSERELAIVTRSEAI
jgi:D-alanine-D-alanine ligase